MAREVRRHMHCYWLWTESKAAWPGDCTQKSCIYPVDCSTTMHVSHETIRWNSLTMLLYARSPVAVANAARLILCRLKRLGRFDEWGEESKLGSSPPIKGYDMAGQHSNHNLHGIIPPVLNRCVKTSCIVVVVFLYLSCCLFEIVVGLIIRV